MEQINNNHFEDNSLKEEFKNIKQQLETKDEDLEKLRNLTSVIANQQKTENNELPVDIQTGRIDMDEYVAEGIYKKEEVDGTKETIRQLEDKWLKKITSNNVREQAQQEINGEKFELLALSTLYKFLHNKFIIIRSARYDDVDNSVDTIIFDKNTGNIVCTLDEGGSYFGAYTEEKKSDTLEKNQKGGARLKYGLILTQGSEGKKYVKGGSVKNIPLFDLFLGYENIRKHLPELSLDLSQISDIEKNLFVYFMREVNDQILEMKHQELNIPTELQQSANNFKSQIEQLYPNIFYTEKSDIVRKKGVLKANYYLNLQPITNDKDRDSFREKVP